MTRVTPPYFFDEFLLPVNRSTLSKRERALGFTVKDLEWLHGVYYASDASRQDTRLQSPPMRVEKLLINVAGQAAITRRRVFDEFHARRCQGSAVHALWRYPGV